jgi:hypothetical protein
MNAALADGSGMRAQPAPQRVGLIAVFGFHAGLFAIANLMLTLTSLAKGDPTGPWWPVGWWFTGLGLHGMAAFVAVRVPRLRRGRRAGAGR